MKLSILLSAYNGCNFVEEQLNSIVNQSRTPDELILVDDCSNDNNKTWNIFNNYKDKYSYIKIYKNSNNLGYESSFYKNLDKINGDILMFCDHDDLWDENKLKIVENCFINNKESGLLHSINYKIDLTNSNKAKNFIKQNNINYTNKLNKNKYHFDNKFILTKGEACGLAIKTSFINKYKDLWIDSYPHDDFWECILCIFDKILYYDFPLVTRRIHENNKTALKITSKSNVLDYLIMRKKLCEKILNSKHVNELSPKKIDTIKKYINYSSLRLKTLKDKSIISWLKIPFKGITFYNKKAAWIRDLLWVFK